jgi:hypothetical protein
MLEIGQDVEELNKIPTRRWAGERMEQVLVNLAKGGFKMAQTFAATSFGNQQDKDVAAHGAMIALERLAAARAIREELNQLPQE